MAAKTHVTGDQVVALATGKLPKRKRWESSGWTTEYIQSKRKKKRRGGWR